MKIVPRCKVYLRIVLIYLVVIGLIEYNNPTQAANSGFFGSLFGFMNSYTLNPVFRKYVLPHITDTSAFSDFMDKYKGKETFTENERIEIIVKIGMLENAPQWITKKGMDRIYSLYPELRTKKTENEGYQLIGLSTNQYASAASASAVPLLGKMGMGEYGLTLAALALVGLKLYNVLHSEDVSNEGETTVANDVTQICLSGQTCQSNPDPNNCEAQVQADEAVCRSLRSPAVRSRCWESAQNRYGACRAGNVLPPLITR